MQVHMQHIVLQMIVMNENHQNKTRTVTLIEKTAIITEAHSIEKSGIIPVHSVETILNVGSHL